MSQPMQPLVRDHDGVIRFQKNTIVCYLLDAGPVDLNDLARLDFPQEDREQFAQLLGYSVSGFGELGYVSAEALRAADLAAEEMVSGA